MAEFVAISLTTVLAVMLFMKLPFLSTLKDFTTVSRKALAVIMAKSISDHWKELILPSYSLQMMRCSMKLLFYLIVVGAFVIVMDFICQTLGIPLIDALSTWSGLATSLLISVVYILLYRALAS